MALAEGVAARVAYKFNVSGSLVSNAEADTSTIPGASGAQVLRRVAANLSLRKNTFQSAEVRADRQIADFRHGTKRVEGSISGELSPATYFELLEAVHRDTAVASITLGPSALTSIVSDNSTSKFTAAGGAPVTLGLRVGDIIRFSGLAATANNNKNFTILSFGGTSNREITVFPAPATDAVADTSFTLTRPGSTTIVPSTAHVSRLAAIEVYNQDTDMARLYTECRFTGYRMGLPAEGMATAEVMVMGRGMTVLEDSFAPYFTSPTAATTTGITAGVNGFLRVGGINVGVVTGIDLSFDTAPSAPSVVGQNFPPEIFMGRANVTGTINALLEDGTLIGNFVDEDEIELLVRLDATSAANTDAVVIYLPRIKLGSADTPTQGEAEQTISLAFQALKYEGAGAGRENTTIRICDTAAV